MHDRLWCSSFHNRSSKRVDQRAGRRFQTRRETLKVIILTQVGDKIRRRRPSDERRNRGIIESSTSE